MAATPKPTGLLLILTLWVVGACATANPGNARNPLLVRLKPDPYATDMADLFDDAKLEIRHGCVYLVSPTGPGESLAVFRSSYELMFSGGQAVGVRDTATGRSLRFGVIWQFGGGSVDVIAPGLVMEPIPAACAGARAIIYF